MNKSNSSANDRKCLDHVFTLNSIIKNRYLTFVSLIDLEKAFDMVDRDVLKYSLIRKGVDGHFYQW